MAKLTLRNCTIWDVHFWREGGNSKAVVRPGKESDYKWSTTYKLKVERDSVTPKGKHSRNAVNQAGTYYVVWNNSKQELDILSEAEASKYKWSKDNKYLSNWFTTYPNWMSELNDDLTIDQLSIPGTHDSGTKKTGPGPAHTQNFDIETQLQDGIRFLDIRVGNNLVINTPLVPTPMINKEDPFKIVHGIVDCGITFKDILNTCSDFLKHNPRETIIMLMDDYNVSPTMAEEGFKRYLNMEQYQNLFYLGTKLPPLGQLRGKVVLLRRFEIESSAELGVNLSKNWPDDDTLSLTTPDGVKFRIEDNYKQWDTHKKVKTVEKCLIDAVTTPDDEVIHITYNSLSWGIGRHTPYQYTWGGSGVDPIMNTTLQDHLTKLSGSHRLGLVILDFYNNKGSDGDIVAAIIHSNDGVTKVKQEDIKQAS
jgi:1-phosphatidylinositol phosphodiesterase